MTQITANGIHLHVEQSGDGEPLVLVHGSWGDATEWAEAARLLSESHRVVAYDRRGHSRSERPAGQGSVHDDAEDLAGLIEALEIGPAHVVSNSFGSSVALRLVVRRPDLVSSLAVHEPALLGLVADHADIAEALDQTNRTFEAVAARIAAGEHEGAARHFIEEVAGPGTWAQLPQEVRDMMVRNAPTFLDELRDPDAFQADVEGLAGIDVPVLVTDGSEGTVLFERTAERVGELIPTATRATIRGAAHDPHLDVPEGYAATIRAFAPARTPQPA